MTPPVTSIATLAPPLPTPTPPSAPALPPMPNQLQNGGPGLGRLPAAPARIAAKPTWYLLVVAVPLALAVLQVVTVPLIPWPDFSGMFRAQRPGMVIPQQSLPVASPRVGVTRPPATKRRATTPDRAAPAQGAAGVRGKAKR